MIAKWTEGSSRYSEVIPVEWVNQGTRTFMFPQRGGSSVTELAIRSYAPKGDWLIVKNANFSCEYDSYELATDMLEEQTTCAEESSSEVARPKKAKKKRGVTSSSDEEDEDFLLVKEPKDLFGSTPKGTRLPTPPPSLTSTLSPLLPTSGSRISHIQPHTPYRKWRRF